MSFGTKLQELRKEKGMTQEELANDLAITPQSVSKWENEQSTPDLDTLVKIAKILGVSCDYLLGNEVEAKVSVKDHNKLLLKLVVDSADGDKVKINLPLSVVKTLIEAGSLKLGDNNILEKIDFNMIFLMIDNGTIGKLLEVDSADGDHVAIFVE